MNLIVQENASIQPKKGRACQGLGSTVFITCNSATMYMGLQEKPVLDWHYRAEIYSAILRLGFAV